MAEHGRFLPAGLDHQAIKLRLRDRQMRVRFLPFMLLLV